jgi:hypothetical protein
VHQGGDQDKGEQAKAVAGNGIGEKSDRATDEE